MNDSKEDFWEALKRKQEQEKKDKEKRKLKHEEFNERIRKELPEKMAEVVNTFFELCKTPLDAKKSPVQVEIEWAYDKKFVGNVDVENLDIKLGKKNIRLRLHPQLGFLGATAKINFLALGVKNFRRLPFTREGFFILIGHKEDEPSKVFWIDKNDRLQKFDENIALETLKIVFLED